METQKYKKLHSKIVELLPEIMELKFGCEVLDKEYDRNNICKFIVNNKNFTYLLVNGKEFQEWKHRFEEHYKILGRPIRLADVLRALNMGGNYFIDDQGFFIKAKRKEFTYDYIIPNVQWNLEKDSLADNPQCWDFLYDLLITK